MGPDPGMFRALIERCPMVTYVCDADDRITYISPQIEAWTGLPARLWTEDPTYWHRMLHPDDRERVLAANFRDGTLDIEYRMRGRDGAWIWVWELEVKLADQPGSQGICLDITALRTAREELEAAQARLTAVVNAAPVILFATDTEGTITLSEGKGLEALGLAPGEMVGKSLIDAHAHSPEAQAYARLALAGESFETHGPMGPAIFDCTWRGQGDGSMIGIAIDVTARHHSEERLAHLAYHDPLTGLPNRSNVEEQLERELARARREGTTVATLYVDLDHFKLVNDSLGHAAGDQVLVQVAERIRAISRGGDLLARLGGDEFVLVCPGIDGAGAVAVAEKILAALDASLVLDGAEFQLGASIGIAVGPQDGAEPRDLLKHGDAAMYQAKRAGRDAYALYSDDAGDSRRRLTLTARLRHALEADQFLLHYQPVYDLRSGALCAVEALVRWQDPAEGLVPPDQFIPHAEETGLITCIGAWVIDAACRQAAEWTALGLAPRMAFNASPRELRDECYVERVADALARHGLRGDQLLIEVRETPMQQAGRTQDVIEQLHRLGVQLALDDFGTEHSSLSRLRELPVQVLKVDRSFLRDVPHDAASAGIVRAIATLAAGLGMDVVAEGIETPAQRGFALEAGCGFGQGYHFSRPVPAAELTELLTSCPAPRRRAAPASVRSRAALRR
jgi:diguanylate cyclase (GGDEF)-like protein/PAS domain S-box-containing protein